MKTQVKMLLLIAVFVVFLLSSCLLKENDSPVVEKLLGPSGNIYDACGTFSWSGYDPDGEITSYYYRKDGGNWIPHETEDSLEWCGYSEGTHTFEVRARDNRGAYSETVSWTFTYFKQLPAQGELLFVKGGTFTMGDTWGDGFEIEKPIHEVTFTYSFFTGKYPVTFIEFIEFCVDKGYTVPFDENWGMGNRPVVNVSWWTAIAYCNWLSEEEGLPVAYRLYGEANAGQLLDADGKVTTDVSEVLGYRLPTEAEWEYAARGGPSDSEFEYSGSDDPGEVAWYDENSHNDLYGVATTWPVGMKDPNALGIYDMSGNVLEWCTDFFVEYTDTDKTNPYIASGTHRVARGGCWAFSKEAVRVSYRFASQPFDSGNIAGFRVVRRAQ